MSGKNFQNRVIRQGCGHTAKAKAKTEADLNDWERKAIDFAMQDDPDSNAEKSRNAYVRAMLSRSSGNMVAKHLVQNYSTYLASQNQPSEEVDAPVTVSMSR